MSNLFKTAFMSLLVIVCSVSCKKSDDPIPDPTVKDVNIAGYEFDITTGFHIAKLWKNDVETDLSDGNSDVWVRSIFFK